VTLIVAHRGASAYQTENSLSAFRLAHAMGADGIELDVHMTADAVPIVHHDPLLDGRPIWLMPLAEVRDRHRLANGEPVPTLSETLAAMEPSLLVFVEVKSLGARDDAQLLAMLRAGPAPERCRVHAFDHRIVRRLRATAPELITGILSASYPVRPLVALQDAGAAVLWQQESLLDAELVDAVHGVGATLAAWTVDDPVRMRVLASLGVDAICTNRPDVAREAIS